MKTRTALVAGTVLSPGLVTGCGGGDADAGTAALAVDTKELLGMVPEGTELPKAFSSNGYTLADTPEGLFAFESEKA